MLPWPWIGPLTWMQLVLGAAFGLFAGMVALDMLHWSQTLEDALELVAGTLIFVGFLAARRQLAQAGPSPQRTLVHAGNEQ
jgi:hypothetical protein